MRGILWFFLIEILETFKCFGHILWYLYTDITLFVIPYDGQSEIVVTLPVGWYYVVLDNRVEKMIYVIFTKIINIKFSTHQKIKHFLSMCWKFDVNYFSKDYVDNLLNSIVKHYVVSTNWKGRNYLRLTIIWNYK